ncbi:MAG: hypothetical protein JKY08_09110 [Flavobacteriaceae bacterium]|nr:hypothetical protein [Flavobacteriaceae bacterium]
MKKIIFSCIGILLFLSCKTTTNLVSEVKYKSYTNQIMSVEAIGYGSNASKALANAQKNAIDVILFRGVPNSNLNSPLVGTNEALALQKHKKYFETFYANKRYLSFITQSVTQTPFRKLENGNKGLRATINVNIQSLRADLEHNGLIRKFGY